MKKIGSWFFPDREEHFIEWMSNPKNHLVVNGRESYQGRKQIAALELCGARNRVALEAGGHIGTWAFNLAKHFHAVHSFEPVAEFRECFEKNVLGANSPEVVTLHPFALGDRPGNVAIRVDPLSTGGSFVKGKGDIEMRTLDSFGFDDVDFIKADAEGFEEFIIRGAEETIERWRPIICVEQKRDMAVKFGLRPMGAVKYLIDTHRYKVVAEISGDYLCVPRP